MAWQIELSQSAIIDLEWFGPMRQITLNEAVARLREYGELCRSERVVVAEPGLQPFEIAPYDEDDDDFMDRLIATNAEFREELAAASE